MPFDPEDKNPNLGDPSTQTTTPLTQKQMQGAQAAAVHRTNVPSASKGPAAQSGNGQAPEDQKQDGEQKGGEGVSSDTPILGGAEALAGAAEKGALASHDQAAQALGFNPAHNQDWWKHALESPLETYFMGRHLYDAYYGAFLNSDAIQNSVHDIWHQDSAVGWLMRNVVANAPGPQQIPRLAGAKPEDVTAGTAGLALPVGADPTNIAYGGMASVRGAALVAEMLGTSAVGAIFTDRHSPSDLAWGVLPAILLGG